MHDYVRQEQGVTELPLKIKMGKNKRMGRIEEDFSEDQGDQDDPSTAPPKKITLAEFDWF